MPLLPLFISSDEPALPLLWESSEPAEIVLEKLMLSTDEQREFQAILLEKRKREWLVTRQLLRAHATSAKLLFHPTGQPFLSDGKHISISHSQTLAGMLISHHPVGIDIQAPDEKIYRIRQRFCQASELDFANQSESPLAYLTVIWCVKEAIFKCFGEHVHFSEHIRVHPFRLEGSTAYADYQGVHGKYSFRLKKIRHLDFFIVWTQLPALS